MIFDSRNQLVAKLVTDAVECLELLGTNDRQRVLFDTENGGVIDLRFTLHAYPFAGLLFLVEVNN